MHMNPPRYPQDDPDEYLTRARADYASAFNAGQRAGYNQLAPFIVICAGLGGLVFPLFGDISHWSVGYGLAFGVLGLGIWWWYTEQDES